MYLEKQLRSVCLVLFLLGVVQTQSDDEETYWNNEETGKGTHWNLESATYTINLSISHGAILGLAFGTLLGSIIGAIAACCCINCGILHPKSSCCPTSVSKQKPIDQPNPTGTNQKRTTKEKIVPYVKNDCDIDESQLAWKKLWKEINCVLYCSWRA